jgi:hypothetical protein
MSKPKINATGEWDSNANVVVPTLSDWVSTVESRFIAHGDLFDDINVAFDDEMTRINGELNRLRERVLVLEVVLSVLIVSLCATYLLPLVWVIIGAVVFLLAFVIWPTSGLSWLRREVAAGARAAFGKGDR